MDADRNAPVFAESSIDIAAPPDVVWAVMAAIDRWPEWNPEVKSAHLEGELSEGATFRWKTGPATITSTLRQVDPPSRIVWTGKTFGIKAIHVWNIEPLGSGARVRTEESWDGLVARMTRRSSQRTVEKALKEGPLHLKAEAERRATGR
jgi:uncharacterized protein YndB with AHSA1/START domain